MEADREFIKNTLDDHISTSHEVRAQLLRYQYQAGEINREQVSEGLGAAWHSVNRREDADKVTYLNVPKSEVEAAKRYGARWSREKKSWFVLGPYPIVKQEHPNWFPKAELDAMPCWWHGVGPNSSSERQQQNLERWLNENRESLDDIKATIEAKKIAAAERASAREADSVEEAEAQAAELPVAKAEAVPTRAPLFREVPESTQEPLAERVVQARVAPVARGAAAPGDSRIDIAESDDARLRRTESGELRTNFRGPTDPSERAKAFTKHQRKLRDDSRRAREAGDVGTADRMDIQWQYEALNRDSESNSKIRGFSKSVREQQEYQVIAGRHRAEGDLLQSRMDEMDTKYGTRFQDQAKGRMEGREARDSLAATGPDAQASYRDSLPLTGQLEYDRFRKDIETKIGRPLDAKGLQAFETRFEARRQETAKQWEAFKMRMEAPRARSGAKDATELLGHREDRKRPVAREIEGYEARRGHDGRTMEYVSTKTQTVDLLDKGRRVEVADRAEKDPDAIRAAVTLAGSKFDKGWMIRGTREMQELYAREAVAQGYGHKVKNSDLKDFIKAETEKLKAEQAESRVQTRDKQVAAAKGASDELTAAAGASAPSATGPEDKAEGVGRADAAQGRSASSKGEPLVVLDMPAAGASQSQVKGRSR